METRGYRFYPMVIQRRKHLGVLRTPSSTNFEGLIYLDDEKETLQAATV